MKSGHFMLNLLAMAPFIPAWNANGAAMQPFAGETVVIGAIVAVLLAPFFVPKHSNYPCGLIALVGLVIAAIYTIHNSGISGEQFGGMLVADFMAAYFKTLLYLFAAGVVLMWFATTSSSMREGDGAEFFVLLLGATLGMALMSETGNLLMIFLAVELSSLPSYVLVGFRKTERLGAEASLKYVLFGAACSSIMVFGLSYLYGLTGSLQISALVQHTLAGGAEMAIFVMGLICVLVGIGFKIAMVPVHFWCPDVFEGAGVDVAAFLSVASKGAGLVLLMRVLEVFGDGDIAAVRLGSLQAEAARSIGVAIGVIGALTATVANVAALGQSNIKRLLAYSSIAHAGYMLCVLPLVLISSRSAAIQAALIYLTVYMFMNLGAFTVAGIVERHDGETEIAGYAGLGRRAPGLAICMTIFLISLIGLPPLAGFLVKLNIMWLLAGAGTGWWVLVAVIAINTVLSVYYYAKVIKAMYFEQSEAERFFPNPLGLGIAGGCAVVLIAIFIFFSAFSHLAPALSN